MENKNIDLQISSDNSNNENGNKYEKYISTFKSNGFNKCLICNLNDEIILNSSNKEFELKPNEILSIKNIFKGESTSGFFVCGVRYYLKNNDDFSIHGSGCSGDTDNIIIERTNNYCFISIYDAIQMTDAETVFSKIMKNFYNENKDEKICNGFFN